MAEAASLPLPYPETAVVERGTLLEQNDALARSLPARPLVLGGCCCSHVGAVRGLAARGGRLSVAWLDAHGDLNTPESSPSGNEWGMPLRMILDEGLVSTEDVALIGARNLDPPEVDYLAATGVDDSLDRALGRVDCVYVAFDLDALEPEPAVPFMPEPDGLSIEDAEGLLRAIAARGTVVGAGITGATPDAANVAVIDRLTAALGL
jgi:arginase